VLFLLCVPVGVLYAGDEITGRSMFIGRYMIGASAGLYVLLAWGLVWAVRPSRLAGVVTALLLCWAVLLPDLYAKPSREDWRGVGAWLREERRPGDELVVSNSVMVHVLRYYDPDAEDAVGLGRSSSPEEVAEIAGRLTDARRVLLVMSHTNGTTIGRLLDHLREQGRTVGPVIRFTAIRARIIE
jgi:hypothetical protein